MTADSDPCSVIAGGKVSQFGPDSVGLNPAWRNAVVEATCGADWEENTPSKEIRARIQRLKERIQAMYDLTPNDGAYLNEVGHRRMSGREHGSLTTILLRCSIGVPVRGRLAENVLRRPLFNVEEYQRQVRSLSSLRCQGGGRVRGLE